MDMGTIFRLDRGPIVEEVFLSKIARLCSATYTSAPWSLNETIAAHAVDRIRRQLALPEATAYSHWNLPQGLSPLRDVQPVHPGVRIPSPLFDQPGASVAAMAFGFPIDGDTGPSIYDEWAQPSLHGGEYLINIFPTPGTRAIEMTVQRLMIMCQRDRGFVVLPEGDDGTASFLERRRWHKTGRLYDDLSGLVLNVHTGPLR
ncbi:hypothetical protein [Nonomuraea bangladeshensis]|uniref:hypothetical protein n=1 Tax=Nonomuraea bangladeshensis TaxID=404385 RepID=UPI0031D18432